MIQITEEMLKQLTAVYNKNEKRYDLLTEKCLKETDPAKRRHYDKLAFGRHCKSTVMDKVLEILGLETDIDENGQYIVKEMKANEN